MQYLMDMCLFHRDKEAPKLTESGFQFLVCINISHLLLALSFVKRPTRNYTDLCKFQLMDTNAQLWYIIREYITNSEVSDKFDIF